MKTVWLPVLGFEGHYEVSDQGSVRSLDRVIKCKSGKHRSYKGRLLRLRVNTNGYLITDLYKDLKKITRTAHSLVAEAFIGPRPNDLEVCHNDGNRLNSCLSNLRYGTRTENFSDCLIHGTRARGSSHGNSKLTESQVIEIKQRASFGERRKTLASEFQIHEQTIGNILRSETWAWLEVTA